MELRLQRELAVSHNGHISFHRFQRFKCGSVTLFCSISRWDKFVGSALRSILYFDQKKSPREDIISFFYARFGEDVMPEDPGVP